MCRVNSLPLGDRRSRKAGGFTMVEAAGGFAIAGSLLLVAIPVLVREFHASRFAEAVNGLNRLGASVVSRAEGRPVQDAFPPPASLEPATPPRGAPAEDPPLVWTKGTWGMLGFSPVPEGVTHSFSFALDARNGPDASSFVAHAHGDLDGDGVTSTFEVRGHAEGPGPVRARLDPGMYVEAEVE